MKSRQTKRLVGAVLLVVMLFAQAVVTFAACDMIASTPRQAFAAADADASTQPCHAPHGNVNLCLAHCQADDLSLDKPQIKVHALFLQSVLTLRLPVPSLQCVVVRAPHADACADPPLRILFQSLRI
jgi:hypothetical protein